MKNGHKAVLNPRPRTLGKPGLKYTSQTVRCKRLPFLSTSCPHEIGLVQYSFSQAASPPLTRGRASKSWTRRIRIWFSRLTCRGLVQAMNDYLVLLYLDKKTSDAPPNYGCVNVASPKRYAELTKQWSVAATQVHDQGAKIGISQIPCSASEVQLCTVQQMSRLHRGTQCLTEPQKIVAASVWVSVEGFIFQRLGGRPSSRALLDWRAKT